MNINKILDAIPHIDYRGDRNAEVSEIIELDANNNRPEVIFWCSDKNIDLLSTINAGTVICGPIILEKENVPGCNYIIVEKPREAFRKLLLLFQKDQHSYNSYLGKNSHIADSAQIGKNTLIGNNVIIEENCQIGDGCIIGHNTIIHHNTVIHNNVKIGSNNTIGGVGFGYEKDDNGFYQVLPHLGNVEIQDLVEIGNNTCIDRAVLGSTLIGKNVKIDNLVHIAHGVKIGANSLIIANSMIAGSSIIGENVWVAPSSSILNKRTVNSNAVIGMGAVVLKDVEEGATVIGNPGKVLEKK